MKTFKNSLAAVALFFALAASAATVVVASPTADSGQNSERQQILKRVRKELVTLPYYGVFDNLAYKVEGDTVTLYGQVVRPSTRSDAGRRVAKIKGVGRVVNNIEVLPLSGFDDSIRAEAYRAIFNTSSLYRYALGSNPSLHIVVNRGHVTLEGVVGNRMDKQLAEFAARAVPGVFSVTNNLIAERDERKVR
ncbi:MAG: hyperosmotically inducible periplasmic protein [Pyrinomonadaceae bacterium]|jgi:hyperosmotically inducible protein|nr:hyperosmotically inducible periplasmic protein [Pyrinomonadaceae bacterium]